ncbi:hypothetical protein DY218_02375 [Streptomyces triticagri]|uniref:Uncharacterized protein n=1 Tax=Streptomyces triticagri TaxID=2293568 RepID=A0A372MBL2_9ACTN|nr:hypothetical protein [Streptomyces triticagri]RFU88279.1 hypothetical protein DY218_02375 [Streptomyces triticagri]
MTASTPRVRFADAGEAADVAAFLARLIHYDKAAVVRLQAGGGALAVFGRPASFEVLAVRSARLAEGSGVSGGPGAPGGSGELDVTVSAGELLEGVDEGAAAVAVPSAVTGPPWAGVLPPKGGWERVPGLPSSVGVLRAVRAAVSEFRGRVEELDPAKRTRGELDRIGREVWSRPVGDTELPVRAAHAARVLGFLPSAESAGFRSGELSLWAAGAWLRLRTPYGAVVVRVVGGGAGLGVMPQV